MDTTENSEYKIKIKISAENGEHIIKEDQIDVSTFHDEHGQIGNGDNSHTTTSYLSKLSSALRSVRHETNSVLTQFISNSSSKNTGTGDLKEIEPDEQDEDISDDENTGWLVEVFCYDNFLRLLYNLNRSILVLKLFIQYEHHTFAESSQHGLGPQQKKLKTTA